MFVILSTEAFAQKRHRSALQKSQQGRSARLHSFPSVHSSLVFTILLYVYVVYRPKVWSFWQCDLVSKCAPITWAFTHISWMTSWFFSVRQVALNLKKKIIPVRIESQLRYSDSNWRVLHSSFHSRCKCHVCHADRGKDLAYVKFWPRECKHDWSNTLFAPSKPSNLRLLQEFGLRMSVPSTKQDSSLLLADLFIKEFGHFNLRMTLELIKLVNWHKYSVWLRLRRTRHI